MTCFSSVFIEKIRVIHMEWNHVTTNILYFQNTIEWNFKMPVFKNINKNLFLIIYFRIEATSATLVLPGMPLPGSHFCSCYLCANVYLNLIPKLRINEQPCLATTGCGSTASRGSFNWRVRHDHFINSKLILESITTFRYASWFNHCYFIRFSKLF